MIMQSFQAGAKPLTQCSETLMALCAIYFLNQLINGSNTEPILASPVVHFIGPVHSPLILFEEDRRCIIYQCLLIAVMFIQTQWIFTAKDSHIVM